MVSNRNSTLILIPLALFFVYGCFQYFQSNAYSDKVVIILGTNAQGGVDRWKTSHEWEAERLSISNKQKYADKYGYKLSLVDMSTRKRYSHEWREGWQKVDVVRQVMRENPQAEWFWWLDLNTFIMDMDVDISKLFKNPQKYAHRSVEYLNPLNIKVDSPFADTINSPIEFLIAQDCGGFSLGSFAIKKTAYSDLLLDSWWDPVFYEQNHMAWEHREQDCLEVLYSNQPWIRERMGFVEMRMLGGYSRTACTETPNDKTMFWETGDWIANIACDFIDWGCWERYAELKQVYDKLNRPWWYL
ncbi:alpha-1,6-mannosyltransferase [Martiniozyma asiatica (nom. inval.)]|nr:alpha-1,6-mannosyltransferase [Martiniozyma asiatica]